jgi:late competence protein required for DNA uptake (superfamily II DNA/RNA helicase)
MINQKRMRWSGHVALTEQTKNVYKILIREFHGKESLRRPRCRWKDNIKKHLNQDRI